MKLFARITRVLLGGVFIFSGFVKGDDPLGFAYKLEDYFIAFQWDSFIPFALFFSILLCTVEFSLGVMLLLNLRLKLASWLVFFMMLFFTGLTLNDAIYSPVPDCGCFGDAIKLTNWQTFYKNLVLLPMSIIVLIYRNKIFMAKKAGMQWVLTGAFALLFSGFSFWCFKHLPVIDFTEWKVGHKLFAENPKPVKYYLTYKNKQSGEQKEYLSPDYPYNDSVWMAQWVFVSQRVEDPNEYFGKSLVITDTAGNVFTESIIRNPGYQLIINSYDLSKADIESFIKLNGFCREASDDGISSAALVGSQASDIAKFVNNNKLQLDFYIADDIVLKTIVRSNPGLLLMKNGEILKKWHYNDIPDYEGFKEIIKQHEKKIESSGNISPNSTQRSVIPKPNPQPSNR